MLCGCTRARWSSPSTRRITLQPNAACADAALMTTGISDPLSGTSPDGGERARARLRRLGALLFGSGAVTLASVLTAPDPDPSDHHSLLLCAGALAVVAAVL